ncbi:hypothetical protein C5B42_04375 [Candidatus Cerribacteria bacterium 'Amazon FNV 2010 28 9']|uniref:Glyoxalase/fosfomycin resistance/dioxygenase domain-containing protein n=1 Tax=Candidatus Cerribacteria bacterium 'Amazon FNV 2010 28 9' TaxID=2081795 RepID=A0A317JPH9_9BACT|nr:MAG: hypothetical protein C5B42_04375 [Candidatus Cerribacteria bacterium 'Amazon FNV 2010 28 9']
MDTPVALTDVLVELHVPDFTAVREFYSKLGFEEVWSNPAQGQSGYVVMKRGTSILSFFCGNDEVYHHPYFQSIPRTTPRGYGVEIAIHICDEDLEIYFNSVKERIPSECIVQTIETKPWGNKDFRLVDPFGFYLCFREPNNILVK